MMPLLTSLDTATMEGGSLMTGTGRYVKLIP